MFLEYQNQALDVVKVYNDYYEAKEEATRQNLLLAEYGDVYGSKIAYAYWNKTGNRHDCEMVMAYYKFNKEGKPEQISEEELKRIVFF